MCADLIGVAAAAGLLQSNQAVADVEQGISARKGNAVGRAASQLGRYVGLEVIACTAQVSGKVDRRIDDEVFMSQNVGQGLGRELLGSDGQFHRTVQGIRPLGSQDAAADVQGHLVDGDDAIFHLDVDVSRFDGLAAERSVTDGPLHGDRRVVTCAADVDLAIQLAGNILYWQGRDLEQTGNVAVDDRRLAPQERRFRIIQ